MTTKSACRRLPGRWLSALGLLAALHLPGFPALAQQEARPVIVMGQVRDSVHPGTALPLLMVVNKATGRGIFGNANGSFAIRARQTDTLIVSVVGYQTRYLCFGDSAVHDTLRVTVEMNRLQLDLEPVVIFPERDLDRIEKDIQQLGYDESEYRLTGIDAWSSPLTALYQEFSRKEKDRRRAAELWNDQRRRELVAELLRHYNKNLLIDLPENRFTAFTDFLRISDAMMKSWSQYEMAVYIKTMYALFRRRD